MKDMLFSKTSPPRSIPPSPRTHAREGNETSQEGTAQEWVDWIGKLVS